MTTDIRQAIVDECERQEESCLYTSTILYIWLRRVRMTRRLFIAAPLVLGGIAGLAVIQDAMPTAVIVLLAFLAGLFPALETALKLETDVEQISRQAGQYKSLQDRFRRIAKIDTLDDLSVAKLALEDAMVTLDQVRALSITAPEKYYERAKTKIARGDYSFAADERIASDRSGSKRHDRG